MGHRGPLAAGYLCAVPLLAAPTPATLADVPAVVSLVNRAYRSDAAQAGWTTEGHLLAGARIDADALRELLAAPEAVLLVASPTPLGPPNGCVYLEKQADVLNLSLLAVAPEAQAHGLGRHLLQAAEAHARARGCTTIKMSVLSVRAELLAWYERQGYRRTGASEPFPNTTRFGQPQQPLTLLALEKGVG